MLPGSASTSRKNPVSYCRSRREVGRAGRGVPTRLGDGDDCGAIVDVIVQLKVFNVSVDVRGHLRVMRVIGGIIRKREIGKRVIILGYISAREVKRSLDNRVSCCSIRDSGKQSTISGIIIRTR